MADDPLILTAALDAQSTQMLQRLRTAHFPARLNIVPAHLTLFHHLSGDRQSAVVADLETVCGSERASPFGVTKLRFLGRGVAYEIDAASLVVVRNRLANRWHAWLTPQDRQGFRPHVTIQNKVDPAEARALFDHLSRAFEPISGTVIGLDLWHYRGGPWEPAEQVRWGP